MARLVDLMIVGAQKAGTSTLLRHLGAHPGVRSQLQREMTCFNTDGFEHQDLAALREEYFGPARPDDASRVHVGKLAGLLVSPDGLERLARTHPSVEVVAILRDPVLRAHSAFWYFRLKGREPAESFEEALAAGPARFGEDRSGAARCDYLEHGLYAKHLERLHGLFGRERTRVLLLEEYHRDPEAALRPLLDRFDLDPALLPPVVARRNAARRPRSFEVARLTSSSSGLALAVKGLLPAGARNAVRTRWRGLNEVPWSPPPLDETTERELRSYFTVPNRDLAQLLGRDLSALWPEPAA